MLLPLYALPEDPVFSRLLKLATNKDGQVIVDDRNRGTQVGYRHILHGIVSLQQKLKALFKRYTLVDSSGFYVAVLAPTGNEFIVAVLSVLALGGVVVPIPTGALATEASHILQKCDARCLLVGPGQEDLAMQIREEIKIASLAIDGKVEDVSRLIPVAYFTLDPALAVSEDFPSILFFTSGTTGPPKGVLHARRTITKYTQLEATKSSDEVCLIPTGAFWSIYFTKIFEMLLTGVRIEIQQFGRHYNLIWEKLRERTGTKIVLSPTFWYGMMKYFQSHISQLPEPTVREYIQGAQYLRDACATGAMPSARVKEFWKDLRGGRSLKVLYGTTETQEIAICDETSGTMEDDLGTPLPNVVLKLSEGEEGELLVKTPSLFLGYLNSPGASAKRFDSDGFFKTGDLAIRRNGRYIFKGRENMDFFKFYTYKVPRTQVESSLTALPYIAEGYIMPVADPQCDTRVAALVRLDGGLDNIDLHTLRTDLSKDMPAYQLPTVLRILRDHETVPRTWSGKTAMMKAVLTFFPLDGEDKLCAEATEVMDISEFMKMETMKPWDLSGIR